MRVGLVCPYSLDSIGGVQQQVLELSEELRNRGLDVGVLAPGSLDRAHPEFVTTTGADVPLRWNGSTARIHWGPRAGARTRAWLGGGYDVLHVHEPVTPSVTWHAVRFASVPVVATAHTSQERGHVLRAGAATVARGVVNSVDAWVAVSEDAATTLRRYCDVDPAVVPNALRVRDFERARRADGPVRVVFLGRLEEPRKGLTVALQAFADVAARHPDIVLDVAGPGDLDRAVRGLRPRLPDDVRRRVRGLGPVDLPAKSELLGSADVVLAPQLGGESFGIVVAEAMAAGAAVLASDLPAFRRLLGDGGCGVIAPRGDVQAWALALERLVTDPQGRARLGERARTAAACFDWRHVTDSLIDLYRQLSPSTGFAGDDEPA
jgi:phosphatidyl-myo-inositol alpha-mannosyltransferase